MKFLVIPLATLLVALGTVSTVRAGTASGTTTLLGSAHADTPVDVDVSITTTSPLVPNEYSLVNQCWFSGRYAGHYDSYERFDLNGPWYDIGGTPHQTVTINLQLVPAGAACKVLVVKNNTLVKGSTTPYTVAP